MTLAKILSALALPELAAVASPTCLLGDLRWREPGGPAVFSGGRGLDTHRHGHTQARALTPINTP
jgi:hypothetical protein